MACYGSLTESLARADYAERRSLEGMKLNRFESEVRTDVYRAGTERYRCELKPSSVINDRLARKVHDDFSVARFECFAETRKDLDRIVVVATELFRATEKDTSYDIERNVLEGIPNDRRIVLAVDQSDCAASSAQ